MGHFCSITRPQNGSLLRYRNQVLLLYAGFTTLWVSVAAIFLEMGESHRMRVMVEPFLFLLVAFYVRGGIRTLLSIVRTRHHRQTG